MYWLIIKIIITVMSVLKILSNILEANVARREEGVHLARLLLRAGHNRDFTIGAVSVYVSMIRRRIIDILLSIMILLYIWAT